MDNRAPVDPGRRSRPLHGWGLSENGDGGGGGDDWLDEMGDSDASQSDDPDAQRAAMNSRPPAPPLNLGLRPPPIGGAFGPPPGSLAAADKIGGAAPLEGFHEHSYVSLDEMYRAAARAEGGDDDDDAVYTSCDEDERVQEALADDDAAVGGEASRRRCFLCAYAAYPGAHGASEVTVIGRMEDLIRLELDRGARDDREVAREVHLLFKEMLWLPAFEAGERPPTMFRSEDVLEHLRRHRMAEGEDMLREQLRDTTRLIRTLNAQLFEKRVGGHSVTPNMVAMKARNDAQRRQVELVKALAGLQRENGGNPSEAAEATEAARVRAVREYERQERGARWLKSSAAGHMRG